MTTAFDHRWNVKLQIANPALVEAGPLVLQKKLERVVPAPLALPVPGAYLLHPNSGDLHPLADLMCRAYGLGFDALPALRMRLHSYFSSGEARPLLDCSWMCFLDGRIVSACLIAMPRDESAPKLIDLVTDAGWQRHGLATTVLEKSQHALVEHGFTSLWLSCHAGDHAAIRKFEQLGFQHPSN
ncbi:MAG: GNAT family N-acetyltransferase [Chloroflexi bacterium]|nr:GNAT family N-acetyltransferase [Chloroflexota bacterium]